MVRRISPSGREWSEVAPQRHKRVVHRIVPVGKGKLAVLGGATRDGNVKEVELIDPAGKPEPKQGH